MPVLHLPTERKFPLCAELTQRMNELIHEYDGQLGVAEAIGCLEIVKHDILTKPSENEKA